MKDNSTDKMLSIFAAPATEVAGSISILPVAPGFATPMTAATFLDNTLPSAVGATAGSTVAMSAVLNASMTANYGGYSDFWIAYYGTASLSNWDFSYWDPTHPQVTKWLINGSDIGADFGNQRLITSGSVGTVSLKAGNDIGDLAYVMVPVSVSGGAIVEYDQFSIITVDPSLIAPSNGAPTGAEIVASAERFAAAYSGAPNDNDCHKIACAVSAAIGAALNDDVTYSLDPAENQDNGFWRVAYRGSDPHPVTNWQTLVKPGDIVRMGWTGGGQHTTTVLSVNANGTIQVFDNDAFSGNTEIIGIHTANYETQTIPATITIYRLSPDHLYYIGGTSNDEQLSGTSFNDDILGQAGADTLTGGIGNDVLVGSSGNDVLIGGAGADKLNGGGNKDTFLYTGVTDSTGATHDSITGFNAAADHFDLDVTVTGIDAAITTGKLRTGHFDTDLAKVLSSHALAAGHAILFTASDGNLAGHTFLIVDANGHAGYQAGADYVMELSKATNLDHLTTHSFT